jgi:hypothetical protein
VLQQQQQLWKELARAHLISQRAFLFTFLIISLKAAAAAA